MELIQVKLINQFWYIWDVFNQIVFSSNRILWILIEIFKSNWSKCNSQHQQQQQPKTDWFDWNNIIYHISYRVTIITGNAMQCKDSCASFIPFSSSFHPLKMWKPEIHLQKRCIEQSIDRFTSKWCSLTTYYCIAKLCSAHSQLANESVLFIF